MASENMLPPVFRVGEWIVEPSRSLLKGNGKSVILEPRAMEILIYLVENAGDVVSSDDIIRDVWDGPIVSDNTVYQWIHKLRLALQDDAQNPSYIETVVKKGYRWVADVNPADTPSAPVDISTGSLRYLLLSGVAILLLALAIWVIQEFDRVNAPPETRSAITLSAVPSIAVLPFANHSGDELSQRFADGLHDELLTLLSRLSSLKVISRTSVMAFRDTEIDVKTIGRRLGVSAIMEGSVQRVDDRLRVSIQLIDAASDSHIWAETFDREFSASGMFEIQTTIAETVTAAFEAEISAEKRRLITQRPARDVEAYEFFLKGQRQLTRRTRSSFEAAILNFEKAIEQDEEFALAWVGLADAYLLFEWYGENRSPALLGKAETAINRALNLDDTLGEAYASLGFLFTGVDNVKAESAFLTSMHLVPSYAPAYHWYGVLLQEQNKPEDALRMFEIAGELDPLSAVVQVEIAREMLSSGQFEQSLNHFQQALEIDPRYPMIHQMIGSLFIGVYGRVDEALKYWKKDLSFLSLEDPAEELQLELTYFNVAIAYLQLGDIEQAEEWMEKSRIALPGNLSADLVAVKIGQLRGGKFSADQYPDELLNLAPVLDSSDIAFKIATLSLYRNFDLTAGRYDTSLQRYEVCFPELFMPEPRIDSENLFAAIDLAPVLIASGEVLLADTLLAKSLAVVEQMPRMGPRGHQVGDVMIYAIQGKKEKSLAALRTAVTQGWRDGAFYHLTLDPNLFSLHGDPRYQAIVEEIKSDMAVQLARLQDEEMPEKPTTRAVQPN